jgi:hypothetical protein
MAACDFNMQFIFAVAGWEGTAHDSRIFQKTIRDPALNFPKPPKGVIFHNFIIFFQYYYYYYY